MQHLVEIRIDLTAIDQPCRNESMEIRGAMIQVVYIATRNTGSDGFDQHTRIATKYHMQILHVVQ